MSSWRLRTTHSLLAVCLIAVCAGPASAQTENHRHWELLKGGRELSPDDVVELEVKIQANPEQVDSRLQLLGFYFSSRYRSPIARAAHVTMALWFIENHPELPICSSPEFWFAEVLDPEGYSKAKKLWLKNTDEQRQNATVLANAARFFALHDFEVAEKLLEQAQKLEPQNAELARQFAELFRSNIHEATGNARRDIASKALLHMERSFCLDQDSAKARLLFLDVADVAFEAGDKEKAERYANQMLYAGRTPPHDWNTGNSVHYGNLALGRLALQAGNIEDAKARLLAAGRASATYQLGEYGPNMTLAKELLDKGEKETVLEYFKLCERLWKTDSKLAEWSDTVEHGGIPEFGWNRRY